MKRLLQQTNHGKCYVGETILTAKATATTVVVAFLFGESIHKLQSLTNKLIGAYPQKESGDLTTIAGPAIFHAIIIGTGALLGRNPMGRLPVRHGWGWLLASGPAWLGSIALMAAISRLFYATSDPESFVVPENPGGISHWPATGWWLANIILAPILEEGVYRGHVSPWMRRNFGTLQGSWFAAIAFAWVHSMPTIAGMIHGNFGAILPGPFLLALVCDWIYIRSGSLWPAIFFHASCNLTPILFHILDPRWLDWFHMLYQW